VKTEFPRRRLEDRIRELSAKTVSTDPEHLAEIIKELRAALHEHTERLKIAVRKSKNGFLVENRRT
jgi:hypothetical protein